MRALGFHEEQGKIQWALVDQPDSGPPDVLAAGSASLSELPSLHRRLAAGRRLPWGLAWSRGETRPRDLPDGWPRLRPKTLALVHPAVAAGIWEWERGRMNASDLFLWLRQNEMHWSAGAPGVGPAGRLSRQGPLQEIWGRLQQRLRGREATVVLAVDEQAPGRELLAELVQSSGLTWRHLQPHPEDRGADRAALGAALAAMEPERPGVLPPQLRRGNAPAVTGLLILGLLGLVGGGARLRGADMAAALPPKDAGLVRQAAALPLAMDRVLDRRSAFLNALEHSLQHAPASALQELELVTGPSSREVLARLTLAPSVLLAAQDWPELSPPATETGRTWTAHFRGRP